MLYYRFNFFFLRVQFVRMSGSKNYFTVTELQRICSCLGLSIDGLKHELVEKIVKFVLDASADSGASHSRVCVTQMRISPPPTSDQCSRTLDETSEKIETLGVFVSGRFKSFIYLFLAFVLFFVGLLRFLNHSLRWRKLKFP